MSGFADENKNLFLLVSDNTGSSADWFTYEFKENNLGTVIGSNNTSGECNGVVKLDYLSQSGIYFYYTPYDTYNSNGLSNSIYGTAPDIYVEMPSESFFIRKQIIQDGQDPYTYENRLKWDNVLLKTLELIKEDENDRTNNSTNK